MIHLTFSQRWDKAFILVGFFFISSSNNTLSIGKACDGVLLRAIILLSPDKLFWSQRGIYLPKNEDPFREPVNQALIIKWETLYCHFYLNDKIHNELLILRLTEENGLPLWKEFHWAQMHFFHSETTLTELIWYVNSQTSFQYLTEGHHSGSPLLNFPTTIV